MRFSILLNETFLQGGPAHFECELHNFKESGILMDTSFPSFINYSFVEKITCKDKEKDCFTEIKNHILKTRCHDERKLNFEPLKKVTQKNEI